MAINYVTTPPAGRKWYVLDVSRTGEKGGSKDMHRGSIRRGRPRNIFGAFLIDCDPELFAAGLVPRGSYASCWLHLGRHRSEEEAWGAADAAVATKH